MQTATNNQLKQMPRKKDDRLVVLASYVRFPDGTIASKEDKPTSSSRFHYDAD